MANGGRCNLPLRECENAEHGRVRRLSPEHLRDVFADRDIRSVGWYWLEKLTEFQPFEPKHAAPVASIARLIHALGDAPQDAAEAAAEAALFGAIMHGIPPRDAAQWEIVERTFDPETEKDLRRWRPNPFTLLPGEDPASMPRRRPVVDDSWDEDPAEDD